MLPPGWVKTTDPNGRTYYANPSTRETRWDPPPPPPPPLPPLDLPPPPLPPPPPPSGGITYTSPLSPTKVSYGMRIERTDAVMTDPTNVSSSSPMTTTTTTTTNPTMTYSTTGRSQAWNNPHSQLVSNSRSMLNNAAAFPSHAVESDLELCSLSPGQIADLCHLQTNNDGGGTDIPYEPINPFKMSTTSQVDFVEGARLEVRLESLREKLRTFQRDR